MNEVLKALGMTKEKAISELESVIASDDDIDFFTRDEKMAMELAISVLKDGWIPIEEREPDNVHERVYVTQLVPKSPCKPNGTTVYITRFIDLHEKKKYITAWRPLPEAYKAEKGES